MFKSEIKLRIPVVILSDYERDIIAEASPGENIPGAFTEELLNSWSAAFDDDSKAEFIRKTALSKLRDE